MSDPSDTDDERDGPGGAGPRGTATDAPTLVDNITVREYDLADLEAAAAQRGTALDDMTKAEKRELVAGAVEPTDTVTTHNVTTTGLHEYVVSNLHPNETVNESAAYVALGDSNTAPAVTNTAINNERYRTGVTDAVNQGRDLLLVVFLDSTEANGINIIEVGTASHPNQADAGHYLFNHALLPTVIEKTDQKVATIEITLEQRDASELP